MRRLVNAPGIVFALFAVWKILLLVLTVQPIPSNDAYFYDGAIVNLLHGGQFVNPTVAIARPYSGTEFFSPYPPLYQGVLYLWMSALGSSAASATGLHVLLVIAWSGLVYLILRRLETPAWAMHLAGGFLFVVTFHDRPDSLAHVLGTGAVWTTVCWLNKGSGKAALWWSALLLALTYSTSLQLGATYTCFVVVTVVGRAWRSETRMPWPALLVMGVTPFALLVIGKYGFPRWWIGFAENAQDNPSTMGLHFPDASAWLKLARTLPGFLLLLTLLPWMIRRLKPGGPQFATFLGALVATLGVTVLSLCYLTPNYLTTFAAYLQPLAIGTGLAWLATTNFSSAQRAVAIGLGCVAIALGGIRAVGMSTWGALCASDVSYRESCRIVNAELNSRAKELSPVVVSAAYLYAAAANTNLNLIHSDYLVRPKGRSTPSDLDGLLAQKPGKLILTQFDYYRRYESVIEQLKRQATAPEVKVKNFARIPTPDAIPSLRKVVQHISWAPVLVEISWPQTSQSQ